MSSSTSFGANSVANKKYYPHEMHPNISCWKYYTKSHNTLEKRNAKRYKSPGNRQNYLYATTTELDTLQRKSEEARQRITVIHQLYQKLEAGLKEVTSICHRMESHFADIRLRSKALMNLILDALEFISMADGYNETNQIRQLRLLMIP